MAARSARSSPEIVKTVVFSWLKALGDGDVNQFRSKTAHRFSFRTTSKVKDCERDFTGSDGAPLFMDCLRHHEKLFVGELAKADVLGPLSQDPTSFSPELRRLLPTLQDGEFVVTTYLAGDGVAYEFLLVLKPDGDRLVVRALVSAMSFDQG